MSKACAELAIMTHNWPMGDHETPSLVITGYSHPALVEEVDNVASCLCVFVYSFCVFCVFCRFCLVLWLQVCLLYLGFVDQKSCCIV